MKTFESLLVIGVLALVIYSSVQQYSPDQCHRPIKLWFCLAGLHIVGFVAAFTLGRRAENGAQWWFVSPSSQTAKVAFTFTWGVLLPLLSAWTAIGMSWLSDTIHYTPDCFTDLGYLTPTMCVLCQVLCGFGALAYAVLVVNVWDAQRCRRANAVAIQSVEDADLVNRWGQLKPSASMELCGGISPQEINDLPRHSLACDDGQCVICLAEKMEGEQVRSLPGCGHTFHRECIDLWLLRRTSCPLCNTDVRLCQSMRQRRVLMSCLSIR